MKSLYEDQNVLLEQTKETSEFVLLKNRCAANNVKNEEP